MLTCGLEADAYLTTQAMKSHLDQVGGCVKRAGWGWTPPLSLALLDAGRRPLQTGVGCRVGAALGAAVEANHLPPVPSRKAGVELALSFPPKLPAGEVPPSTDVV